MKTSLITSLETIRRELDRNKIFLELLTLIAAVWGAIYVTRQASLAQQANQQSADAFRVQQRAWVAPAFSTAAFTNDGPLGKVTYFFETKNYGPTPALHVRQIFHYKFDPVMPIDKPAYFRNVVKRAYDERVETGQVEDGGNTLTYLVGGQSIPTGRTTNQTLLPSDIGRLNASQAIESLYGVITYDDIFGGHHSTQFCIYYGPTNEDLQKAGWRLCEIDLAAD